MLLKKNSHTDELRHSVKSTRYWYQWEIFAAQHIKAHLALIKKVCDVLYGLMEM